MFDGPPTRLERLPPPRRLRQRRGPRHQLLRYLNLDHFESTDDDVASFHIPSVQTGISVLEDVREAMNGTGRTDNPAICQRVNNGILEDIFVRRRDNFLVPPRRLRSFPTPTGE